MLGKSVFCFLLRPRPTGFAAEGSASTGPAPYVMSVRIVTKLLLPGGIPPRAESPLPGPTPSDRLRHYGEWVRCGLGVPRTCQLENNPTSFNVGITYISSEREERACGVDGLGRRDGDVTRGEAGPTRTDPGRAPEELRSHPFPAISKRCRETWQVRPDRSLIYCRQMLQKSDKIANDSIR